jgi:hypothetical protein
MQQNQKQNCVYKNKLEHKIHQRKALHDLKEAIKGIYK